MKINREKINNNIKSVSIIAFITILIYINCSLISKKQENDIKINYIEPYCSARYEHNVMEYKKCKELNSQKLIEKLTKETKKEYEVPNMPVIKE